MTDIVERLRNDADILDRHPAYRCPSIREAADEIEWLRADLLLARDAWANAVAEIKRLQAEQRPIADDPNAPVRVLTRDDPTGRNSA